MEYTITRINDNDELMHYGVPGMKWGHRKTIVSTSEIKLPGMVKGGPSEIKLPGMVKGGPSEIKLPGMVKGGPSKVKLPGMVKGGPTNPRPVSLKDIKNRYKETKKRAEKSPYRQEIDRQKKHINTKRAINVGAKIANNYLNRTQTTLNGKPLRISNVAVAIVNNMLDRKYARDTLPIAFR